MGPLIEPPPFPEGAVENADGSVTLPLHYPVDYTVGSEVHQVLEVTVRRKKMADTIAIKGLTNAVDVIVTTIELLTGLNSVAVKKLDDVDAHRIIDIVEGFSRPGRATGSSASA